MPYVKDPDHYTRGVGAIQAIDKVVSKRRARTQLERDRVSQRIDRRRLALVRPMGLGMISQGTAGRRDAILSRSSGGGIDVTGTGLPGSPIGPNMSGVLPAHGGGKAPAPQPQTSTLDRYVRRDALMNTRKTAPPIVTLPPRRGDKTGTDTGGGGTTLPPEVTPLPGGETMTPTTPTTPTDPGPSTGGGSVGTSTGGGGAGGKPTPGSGGGGGGGGGEIDLTPDDPSTDLSTSSTSAFFQQHKTPILVGAAALVALYLYSKRKKR